MFARVFDACVAENFQSIALRIIHQEKRDTIVRGNIAGGKYLAIAFVICEGELGRTENAKKSGFAAAMLNIRPAVFGDCGHVETVSSSDEFDFFGREQVAWFRFE